MNNKRRVYKKHPKANLYYCYIKREYIYPKDVKIGSTILNDLGQVITKDVLFL